MQMQLSGIIVEGVAVMKKTERKLSIVTGLETAFSLIMIVSFVVFMLNFVRLLLGKSINLTMLFAWALLLAVSSFAMVKANNAIKRIKLENEDNELNVSGKVSFAAACSVLAVFAILWFGASSGWFNTISYNVEALRTDTGRSSTGERTVTCGYCGDEYNLTSSNGKSITRTNLCKSCYNFYKSYEDYKNEQPK